MKKVVAMLLIVATLCLPLCGLADTKNVVAQMFDLTNEWVHIGQNDYTGDKLFLLWLDDADCFLFAYKGENYAYKSYYAELFMATCLSAALADEDMVYGTDWIFSVGNDIYTEKETQLFMLSLAAKYLN